MPIQGEVVVILDGVEMIDALLFAVMLLQAQPMRSPQTVEIAPGSPPSAAAPGSLPEEVREGDRLICRSEPVLGSNRRQRVCMTAAQRQRLRDESSQFRDSLDRQYNPAVGEQKGGG